MAKQLLLNKLTELFGDYVVGLTHENLKVGVWSGNIELDDLQLNENSINELQLPVTVNHGSVAKFKVQIPWLALDREPVKVEITGVNLVIGPIVQAGWDDKEVRKRRLQIKKMQLQDAENAFKENLKKIEQEKKKGKKKQENQAGWIEGLLTKVVDNLQVHISSVHVRYEDDVSSPGKLLSAGITLNELTVCTTDDEWKEIFVDRTKHQEVTVVNKLGKILHLAVYFNVGSESDRQLKLLEHEDVKHAMEDLVARSSAEDKEDGQPVLPPVVYAIQPVSVKVHLLHNSNPRKEPNKPMYDLTAAFSPFDVKLGSDQFLAIFEIKKHFELLMQWQLMYPYRPKKSVTEDPKAWWQYAYKFVTYKNIKFRELVEIAMDGKVYSSYYKRLKKCPGTEPLSDEEMVRYEEILDKFPVDSLVIFNYNANLEIEEVLKAKKDLARASEDIPFWQFWDREQEKARRAKVRKETEKLLKDTDDVSMEELIDQGLALANETAALTDRKKLSPEFIMYSIHVSASSSLTLLSADQQPIITSGGAFNLGGTMRADNNISISFETNKVELEDLCTQSPVNRYLASVIKQGQIVTDDAGADEESDDDILSLGSEDPIPILQVNVNISEHQDLDISVILQPLQITYNKGCIERLLGAFAIPPSLSERITADTKKNIDYASIKVSEVAEDKNSITISIDAQAPKIIVPYNPSNSAAGFLYLDMGHLELKGGTTLELGNKKLFRPDRMMWKVSLSNTQARLTHTYIELARETDSYIIEPFQVEVLVNCDDMIPRKGYVAQMYLEVNIPSPIQGVISNTQLYKLLKILIDIVPTVEETLEVETLLENEPSAQLSIVSAKQTNAVLLQSLKNDTIIKSGKGLVLPIAEEDTQPNMQANMQIKVHVDSVKLALERENAEKQLEKLFEFGAEEFNFVMNTREYDMDILITLNSVSISDLRPENEANSRILYSVPDKSTGNALVQVQLLFSSPDAPTYNGRDMEIEVRFSTLQIEIDPNRLAEIKPFYLAIVGEGGEDEMLIDLLSQRKRRESSVASATSLIRQTVHSQTENIKETDTSLKVLVALQKVGLKLLRNDKVPIVSAAVSGVTTDVDIYKGEILCDVVLKSFVILDERPKNVSNVYRELVKPRDLGQTNELTDSTALLTVKFKGTETTADVDVHLNELQGWVVLESVLEAIDYSLRLNDSIMEMLGMKDQQQIEMAVLRLRAENNLISSTDLAPIKEEVTSDLPEKTLNVQVDVINPEFLLVEEASIEQTKALVLKTSNVAVNFRSLQYTSIKYQLDHLQLHIENLECFINLDVTGQDIIQVIEPFSLSYQMGTKMGLSETMEPTPFEIETTFFSSKLDGRVSFRDIALVMNIVNQALVGLDESKPEEQDESADDTEKEGFRVSTYEEPTKVVTQTVRVRADDISFIVLNDFESQDQPVLRLHVSNIHFNLDGAPTTFEGKASLKIGLDFFNNENLYWEPVLEVCEPEAEIKHNMDGAVTVDVKAEKDLYLNLTSEFLKVIMATHSLLLWNPEKSKARSHNIPYLFINETGVPLQFSKTNQPEDGEIEVIDTGRSHNIEFESNRDKEFSEILDQHRLVAIALDGEFKDTRKWISNLSLMEPGPKVLSWDIKEALTDAIYAAPVVEETYQYRRFDHISRKWREPFLPLDKAEWMDRQRRVAKRKEDVELEGDWLWLDDWAFDCSIQPDGWEYAMDFTSFTQRYTSRGKREGDPVRRRRWVRTRAPPFPDYDDPERPLYLTWDVDVQPSGRTVITARSFLRLVNKTSIALEVEARNQGCNYRSLGVLNSQSSSNVKITDAFLSHFQFRPANSNYSYSEDLLVVRLKHKNGVVAKLQCGPEDGQGSNVYLLAQLTIDSQDLMTVTVSAPFVLHNLLPCTLLYTVGSMNETNVDTDRILSADSKHLLHAKNSTQFSPSLEMRIGNYEESQILEIQFEGKEEKERFIQLPDGQGNLDLDLKVTMKTDAAGIVHITLSCLYWLINRTGLNLCYQNKGKICAEPPSGTVEEFKQELEIKEFQFDNNEADSYDIKKLRPGTLLYSDKKAAWKDVPPEFLHEFYIQTCSSDYDRTGNGTLISFQVTMECRVYILSDARAIEPAFWMEQWEEYPSDPIVISERTSVVSHREFRFKLYFKDFPAGSLVELGMNGGKNMEIMYTAIIKEKDDIPLNDENLAKSSNILLEGDLHANNFLKGAFSDDKQILDNAWAMGTGKTSNIRLYSCKDKKITVGVRDGETTGWSSELDIDINNYGAFTVSEGQRYDLQVAASICPGIFNDSTIIEFTPRYMIVNLTEYDAVFKQLGFDERLYEIKPNGKEPFHWEQDVRGKNKIRLKLRKEGRDSTGWSYGGFSPDAAGGTSILLPVAVDENDKNEFTIQMVVNVEVKLASREEGCAVMIILWEATKKSQHLYRISNKTQHLVEVWQEPMNDKILLCVEPGQDIEYGWADPCLAHSIVVLLPEADGGQSFSVKQAINPDVINEKKKITLRGQTVANVGILASGSTKVVKIYEDDSQFHVEDPADIHPSQTCHVNIQLKGIYVSLVRSVPDRREILAVYIRDLLVYLGLSPVMTSLEMTIKHFQIDNFMTERVFPVMLVPVAQKMLHEEAEDLPFLHLVVDKKSAYGSNALCFDQVSLRILQFEVLLDTGTVLSLLKFLNPLSLVDKNEAIAEKAPRTWVQAQTHDCLNTVIPGSQLDMEVVRKNAQGSRIYFQKIVLHPMKFSISFIQNPTTADEIFLGQNVVKLIQEIITLDHAQIMLKSFVAEYVMHMPESLNRSLASFYQRQFQGQIMKIAGSISMLGSPADLLDNIGTGVSDFFYEPAAGIMLGPLGFAKGFKKGAQSLVQNVVHGAFNSVAGIGDAAFKGVGMLSMDHEYQQNRERKKNKRMAQRGGIKEGFRDGGEALGQGIFQGITGVVRKPYQGAKQRGVKGFFQGVGQGIVGVAVKPVVGIGDAAVSVLQGVSQEALRDFKAYEHSRFRRALSRHPDTGKFVLDPWSELASFCQQRMHSGETDDEEVDKDDLFEGVLPLTTCWLVFGTKNLILIPRADSETQRKIQWKDVGYYNIPEEGPRGGEVEIHLVNEETIQLPTADSLHSELVQRLWMHDNQMENASMNYGPSRHSRGSHRHIAPQLSLEQKESSYIKRQNYTWGTINGHQYPKQDYEDNEIVQRAKNSLPKNSADEWEKIDEAVWRLLSEWTSNHTGFATRKCLAVVIINTSSVNIQLKAVEIFAGRFHVIIPGPRYIENSKTLLPRGILVVFGWGHRAKFVNKSTVVLKIQTEAFDAEISNQSSVFKLNPMPGFDIDPLEKTISEKYAKFVLTISK